LTCGQGRREKECTNHSEEFRSSLFKGLQGQGAEPLPFAEDEIFLWRFFEPVAVKEK
jgi:hypothetical protein